MQSIVVRIQQQIPPPPAPIGRGYNGGFHAGSDGGLDYPLDSPARDEAALRLAAHSFDQIFTEMGVQFDALREMSEDNEGGVIELQKRLSEQLLALRTQIARYEMVMKDMENE
jgi:hypothetical protein